MFQSKLASFRTIDKYVLRIYQSTNKCKIKIPWLLFSTDGTKQSHEHITGYFNHIYKIADQLRKKKGN